MMTSCGCGLLCQCQRDRNTFSNSIRHSKFLEKMDFQVDFSCIHTMKYAMTLNCSKRRFEKKGRLPVNEIIYLNRSKNRLGIGDRQPSIIRLNKDSRNSPILLINSKST